MEYILSAIWILLEQLTFVFFGDALLYRRRNRTIATIAFVLTWIALFIYSRLFLNEIIKLALTVSCILGLSFFLFKGSIWRHILYAIISYSFMAIVDIAVAYGMSALLGISYTEIIWRPLLYTIIVTTAKLLSMLVAHIVRLTRKASGSPKIKGKWLLLTLLFPAVSAFMIVIVFNGYSDRADLSTGAFIFGCVLFVANIAILYIISAMEKSTEKEKELVLLNQQMDIQTKNILALERSYRMQRSATHEFNHQLQTIQSLLANNEHETLKEFLAQLQSKQPLRAASVNSQHPIIDAILNQKYHEALEQSIDVQLQVNDLSGLTLKPNALVVLLSNLFDNAIEACVRLSGDRAVHCSVLLNESLFISVRNTSMPVTIVNGIIETTKDNKAEHGYGLINIYHILNMLHAEYTFKYEAGWFQFVAEIPNPTL